MAIQTNIENSNFGVPFVGAYFRIVNIAVSRTRNEDSRFNVMIDVAGYATQPQNEDIKDIDFCRYHVPLSEVEGQNKSNFLQNCYAWVMSQPNMVGSTSV